MPSPSPKGRHGFTLIDLLVAVAIIAIVLVFGVPTIRKTIQENQITTQSNALVIALNYARSAAINRNLPVTVCAAGSNLKSCSGNNDWSKGWIVFTDQGTPGQVDGSSGDTILRVHAPLAGGTQVTPNSANPAPDYVRYLPSGMLDTNNP